MVANLPKVLLMTPFDTPSPKCHTFILLLQNIAGNSDGRHPDRVFLSGGLGWMLLNALNC